MKKIIDGLRYNTENAIEIGSASYNGSKSDFHYWSETLYKTPRSGKFFLAGEGHGLSRWGSGSMANGTRTWGEGIRPLTSDDARQWCEQYLEGDEWAEHFADQIQDA